MTAEKRVTGPPGCGKTYFLTQVLTHAAQTYGSDAVIACSLTHAAAEELVHRKAPISQDHIGTLHSFAYRALDRPELMETYEGISEFNETVPTPLKLSGGARSDKTGFDIGSTDGFKTEGDGRHAEYMRLRARMTPRELWPQDVEAFALRWEQYKADTDSIDFTDMLELSLRDVDAAPDYPRVIVADEVQDMSKLSMSLLWKWAERADEIVTAGDADQSIFGFAGADPQVFRDRPAEKTKLLEQSYRVPRAVHEYACQWIRQNTDRDDVRYLPRDADGAVRHSPATWHEPQRMLPEIQEYLAAGKTVMLLTSCGYMLKHVIEMLRRHGLAYHNPHRPAEGAWNPLRSREDALSAADRLLAYLRPFMPGQAAYTHWTERELAAWMEMTKHLRTRGMPVPDTGEPERHVEILTLMQLIAGEPQAAILCGDLDTLRRHLAKRWERSASYAIDIAQQHGVEALQEEPQIVVGTIHSVKGGEADVVYLMPDLSFAGYQQWQRADGKNSIRRVYYVGMTRAREELVLCDAATSMGVGWTI